MACTMGLRWGEPARSQAALLASIAVMAACRVCPPPRGPLRVISATALSPRKWVSCGKTGCGTSTACWTIHGCSMRPTKRWHADGQIAAHAAGAALRSMRGAPACLEAHAQLELRVARTRSALESRVPPVHEDRCGQGARCKDAGQAGDRAGASDHRADPTANRGDCAGAKGHPRPPHARGHHRGRSRHPLPDGCLAVGRRRSSPYSCHDAHRRVDGRSRRQVARPHAQYPALSQPARACRAQPRRAEPATHGAVLPQIDAHHPAGGRSGLPFRSRSGPGDQTMQASARLDCHAPPSALSRDDDPSSAAGTAADETAHR
jgi:hypothetical protein